MDYYNNGSHIVEMLNDAAAGVMAAQKVPVIDLYSAVVNVCGGTVPYTYCPVCSDNPGRCQFHYTSLGYQDIAAVVTAAIQGALALA